MQSPRRSGLPTSPTGAFRGGRKSRTMPSPGRGRKTAAGRPVRSYPPAPPRRERRAPIAVPPAVLAGSTIEIASPVESHRDVLTPTVGDHTTSGITPALGPSNALYQASTPFRRLSRPSNQAAERSSRACEGKARACSPEGASRRPQRLPSPVTHCKSHSFHCLPPLAGTEPGLVDGVAQSQCKPAALRAEDDAGGTAAPAVESFSDVHLASHGVP